MIIASFMLVEIYSLALERQPALSEFGRGIVVYLLAAAGSIPILEIAMDHSSIAGAYPVLRTFFLIEQTIDGTIAIFLILIAIFLAWFPVGLSRNVIFYVGGFIVWFLSHSVLIHVANKWLENGPIKAAADVTDMSCAFGCLLFWMIGLRRTGVHRTVVVGHFWNRADATRLVHQLDTMNNGLESLRHRGVLRQCRERIGFDHRELRRRLPFAPQIHQELVTLGRRSPAFQAGLDLKQCET
jgi:hypothetical protein